MLGSVVFNGHTLFLDHAALYMLEEQHGLEPETVFAAAVRPKALRAVLSVALARAKARGLAVTAPSVDELLEDVSHQDAVKLAHRLLSLSIFGRELTEADGESAEGKPEPPAGASAA